MVTNGAIVVIVVFALIIFIVWAFSRSEKRNASKTWDKDREPQESDFTTDIGGKTALEKYYDAHIEWDKRMIRQVVYELPLEEVLKRDDLGGRYFREIAIRNREHYRDMGNRSNDAYRPCCQVCGNLHSTVKNEYRIELCDKCLALLRADSLAGSGYKLPSGATGFSAQLWVHQMVIALDLETGVINKAQAERELRIIVELERRRIAREEQHRQREAEEQQKAERKLNDVANAAKHLH